MQAKAWAPAVEEQKEIIKRHGPELTFEALSEMEVLHRNITEALRLHPPLILLMRYCKAPFTVTTRDGKSYVVPKVREGVRLRALRCGLCPAPPYLCAVRHLLCPCHNRAASSSTARKPAKLLACARCRAMW